ncbi:ABC-type phosphate transport system substrate-binding protein [Knoellia remsis]|uniref:ABC-type phosphate transport system substrate-binding protein n=1 Tax=Knoellia remsis TaxID=407159 RepID=A0A2T0UXZ0_9MICO|nr:substrate-binding domain-containing protein [Knoellia remsis]PRY62800.1 ABC-type phosphate transport system substrate-binding protein [Knoellia remsis]
MSITAKSLAAAACGVVALVGVTATSAQADPPAGTVPALTDIVGVGSDTTQDALNNLSEAYNATSPANKVYSWDATGTSPIVTKQDAAPIERPNGSSAGITLLQNTTTSVVDYARSSRVRKTSGADAGTIFLPFAKDVLKYASATTTNAPQNLTKAQLTSIYNCTATTWNQVGGTSTATIQPKLPQAGSGTRATFLGDLGITTPGSCVDDTVQEHDPAAVAGNPDAIAPFSEGRYNALPDPKTVKLNTSGYSLTRNLYNVVRDINGGPVGSEWVNGGVEPRLQAFFGDGLGTNRGWICGSGATSAITAAGFVQLTAAENCGKGE